MPYSGDPRIPRSSRPDAGRNSSQELQGDIHDTIAAVITPPGQGGVAAVRVAGPDSRVILERVFRPTSSERVSPFLMRHGQIIGKNSDVLDEVLAVFMPAGHSYTGLDQVEIFCHGGSQVVRMLLELILDSGARPAEPGEFTKLAFLNGRIDLAQAEAVAELIASSTRISHQAGRDHLTGVYSSYVDELRNRLLSTLADLEASIDFADDDVAGIEFHRMADDLSAIRNQITRLAETYRGGRIIREGFRVAVCGRPNAGKSSLFNLLLAQERALVDPEAGTTRDFLSEWIDLDGFAVNLIDTAGIRETENRLELQGQAKASEIIEKSDLILWLADISQPEWQLHLAEDIETFSGKNILLVANKIDLSQSVRTQLLDGIFPLSCVTKEGLNQLRRKIVSTINEGMPDLTSGHLVTSARHKYCLDRAGDYVERAVESVSSGESAEIIAFELRQAAEKLGEITGHVYTEEILGEIFSRFCIGK
jgi:tRNA modification GTPase